MKSAEVIYDAWVWRRSCGGARLVTARPLLTSQGLTSRIMAHFRHPATPLGDAEDFIIEMPGEKIEYRPLHEDTGLFHALATMERSPDGCVAFASRYGLLGGEITRAVRWNGQDALGEPLRLWYRQVNALWIALDLWMQLSEDNQEALRRRIEWKTEAVVMNGIEVIPGAIEGCDRGDITGPAWRYLRHMLDKELQHRMAVRAVIDGSSGRPTVHLEPSSLAGALWLQLALAVAEDKNYRACAFCGRWIEITPGLANVNRKYCSDACRMRAYRSRLKAKKG